MRINNAIDFENHHHIHWLKMIQMRTFEVDDGRCVNGYSSERKSIEEDKSKNRKWIDVRAPWHASFSSSNKIDWWKPIFRHKFILLPYFFHLFLIYSFHSMKFIDFISSFCTFVTSTMRRHSFIEGWMRNEKSRE